MEVSVYEVFVKRIVCDCCYALNKMLGSINPTLRDSFQHLMICGLHHIGPSIPLKNYVNFYLLFWGPSGNKSQEWDAKIVWLWFAFVTKHEFVHEFLIVELKILDWALFFNMSRILSVSLLFFTCFSLVFYLNFCTQP